MSKLFHQVDLFHEFVQEVLILERQGFYGNRYFSLIVSNTLKYKYEKVSVRMA
jgi:hypothetical protein